MSLIPQARPRRRFPMGGDFDFNDPKAFQFLQQMQNRGDPLSGLLMDQALRGMGIPMGLSMPSVAVDAQGMPLPYNPLQLNQMGPMMGAMGMFGNPHMNQMGAMPGMIDPVTGLPKMMGMGGMNGMMPGVNPMAGQMMQMPGQLPGIGMGGQVPAMPIGGLGPGGMPQGMNGPMGMQNPNMMGMQNPNMMGMPPNMQNPGMMGMPQNMPFPQGGPMPMPMQPPPQMGPPQPPYPQQGGPPMPPPPPPMPMPPPMQMQPLPQPGQGKPPGAPGAAGAKPGAPGAAGVKRGMWDNVHIDSLITGSYVPLFIVIILAFVLKTH